MEIALYFRDPMKVRDIKAFEGVQDTGAVEQAELFFPVYILICQHIWSYNGLW